METKRNNTAKLIPTRAYHASPRLTHAFKRKIEQQIKWLFVNKEYVEYIHSTITMLPQKDKLVCLYYFKKLAVQIKRAPDQTHYEAFQDKYDDEIANMAEEQAFYEPVRWIEAEIEYLNNTMERLTSEDVNKRLDVLTEAKQKLSKDWLTSKEVMELFTISKSTLNRRISEGMPNHKRGKATHFYLEEISKWMKQEAA